MQIDILTLFPNMFSALDDSIIKRAKASGKVQINLVNFREYSTDKHRKVDDYSFSGGAGLVISAQPIVDCVESIDPKHEAHRIFMTPVARVLTQKRVIELGKCERLLILCGHYEGVDQRAIDLCFDEVLSIGDYVLTGGEIPAMVLVDAVVRQIDGVINTASLANESFSDTLLEYPQYTRPREFRGVGVPEVLFSGNHAEIEKWKYQESVRVTKKYRPELIGKGVTKSK
jgi:tRNA (guanine37-N1)-methyltransferase